MCARKPQTTWKTAHSLISTYPYFPSQVDITINEAHTDTLCALCSKLEVKTKRSLYYQSESERLVKASFVMHCLSCSGVLTAYWITEAVSFHEETGGGDRWKRSSDLNCFGTFLLKVLYDVDEVDF